MAQIKRKIEKVTGLAASTQHSYELPRDNHFRHLRVLVGGNLVVGAFAATLTQDGILNFIKDIRVKATGGNIDGEPVSMDSFQLVKSNWLRSGAIPYIQQPVVTVGTNPFFVELLVPFNFKGTTLEDLSLLSAKALSSLTLDILTGAVTDMATAGGGGTIALSGLTIEAYSLELTGINAFEKIPHKLENRLIPNRTIAGAADIADYAEIKGTGFLKSIVFETEASSLNDSAVIGKIELTGINRFTGKLDTIRQTSFKELLADNIRNFNLQVQGLTNPAIDNAGFSILELDTSGNMNRIDLIDFSAYSMNTITLRLEFLKAGNLWVTTETVKEPFGSI